MEGKYPQRITVAVLPVGNIMLINRSEDGRIEFSGVEGRFLTVVLSFLGLQYDFVIPQDRQFGKLLPDGNWSGMVGMVQRGEADLACSYLGITVGRSQVVGYSAPYVADEFIFVSQTPRNRISLFTFLYPFDLSTWISLLVMFCLVSVVLALCKNHVSSAGNCFYRLFGSSLGQSVKIDGKTVKFNLLKILWILPFQVIAISYCGKLLSFLVEPMKEDAIRNFIDLSKKVQKGSHEAGSLEFAVQYLLAYNEGHFFELGKIIISNNWIVNSSHLNVETYIKPNFCLGINRNHGKLIFGARDDLYFSEDRLYFVFGGFAYNNRFCCVPKLKTILHRAWSAVLYNKFLKDESFKTFLRFNIKGSEISETVSPLSIVILLGPFILLVIGLLLSCITFLAEILYSNYA